MLLKHQQPQYEVLDQDDHKMMKRSTGRNDASQAGQGMAKKRRCSEATGMTHAFKRYEPTPRSNLPPIEGEPT